MVGLGSLEAQRIDGVGHPGDVAGAVSKVLCCFLMPVSFLVGLSGIIGERLPIRYYLTFGMLASGAFTALFGLGYFYNIHSLGFYVVTQVRF